MALYHFQVGIPSRVREQITPLFGLTYSPHAREEAHRDERDPIENLPRHFLPRVARIIEVETDDKDRVVKVLARQTLDRFDDVVFAVLTQSKVVKTVWRNRRSDTHHTLDRSKYDTP